MQEKGETLTSRRELQQTPPPPKIQTIQTLRQAGRACNTAFSKSTQAFGGSRDQGCTLGGSAISQREEPTFSTGNPPAHGSAQQRAHGPGPALKPAQTLRDHITGHCLRARDRRMGARSKGHPWRQRHKGQRKEEHVLQHSTRALGRDKEPWFLRGSLSRV